MADDGEEEDEKDMEIRSLNEEIDDWKKKYKPLELKKRESDINLNKIKTEINSLRSVDKNWKESAKTVYLSLKDVTHQFGIQADQIMGGLTTFSKTGERISEKVPYFKVLRNSIKEYQERIRTQEMTIMDLNGKIHRLTATLDDKTKKIERLSAGIEEEVSRLTKPMRDKVAQCMVAIMAEKAGRQQERRELADLWPDGHLLPSVVMRHRALTAEEQERRANITLFKNASFALSVEIRANVTESKSW
jgi:chromosome segregation ATPase